MLPRTGRPQTHTSAGIWGQPAGHRARPGLQWTARAEPQICMLAVADRHCCPCRTEPGVVCGTTAGGVGSRRGAVVPELLLVAGTGLPAALFPGFVMRHGEGPPGWSGSAADLRTMRETPDQARTDHGAATPGATSRQAPARLRGCARRDRRP